MHDGRSPSVAGMFLPLLLAKAVDPATRAAGAQAGPAGNPFDWATFSSWFYDGWHGIVRVAVMALMAYPMLILFLRLSGKRTLSKMNAFDFVVTVATGSTLAATFLNSSVSIAEGATAFAMLVGLQFCVAWLAARSSTFAGAIKGRPTILLWDGEVLEDVCRKERVTPPEVDQAIRTSGLADRSDVKAVVLETTGDLSVLPAGTFEKGDEMDAYSEVTNNPGNK